MRDDVRTGNCHFIYSSNKEEQLIDESIRWNAQDKQIDLQIRGYLPHSRSMAHEWRDFFTNIWRRYGVNCAVSRIKDFEIHEYIEIFQRNRSVEEGSSYG